TRCAKERRVFFIEEPISGQGPPRLEMRHSDGVWVGVPSLPDELSAEARLSAQQTLLRGLFRERGISDYVLWYYTPMALTFTGDMTPHAVIYDCMDELSAFKGAPQTIQTREAELLASADVVFTGGQSLYEVKRDRHPNIHLFPSSVDVAHFAQARGRHVEPPDQAGLARPRIGFFGVIDERMDLELIAGIAQARPDWSIVLLGPVVKIDPAVLPQGPNLHYLGRKSYGELPAYLAGWDVALLPFARNEATRFISPTKTPEYLAAGKPVVSTSIADVVRPYGRLGLARIADTLDDFIAAVEACLQEDGEARVRRADEFLKNTSWDRTWHGMRQLLDQAVHRRTGRGASHGKRAGLGRLGEAGEGEIETQSASTHHSIVPTEPEALSRRRNGDTTDV
ncbi:MAG: glycosyltransferase family 1 protein, partial [Nitrospiraceae bacterium]|nr:glycosyltransferase family 1 protein [Nitrospiraceae bacterium]